MAVRPVPAPAARRAAILDAPAVRYALLFLGAVAVSAFTIRRGLDPFDEGLTLQAARRVADGEMPYRDFLWSYGWAQPYLLGGLFEAFGTSLIQWRVVRVAVNGAVAVLVFTLVRREAPVPLALVAWLAAACAMAEPTGPAAAPAALGLGLAAILVAAGGPPAPRRAMASGALTALAAAWRPDFAAYAAAGALVALAVAAAPGPARRRAAGFYAAAAGGLGLLLYLPFALAAGPARLYDRLVATALRDRDHWTLPWPLDYDGPLRLWPPGALARDLPDVLTHYVPWLLAGSLVVGAAAWALLARRGRRVPPAAAALLVFSLGGLLYLRSRTDVVHQHALLVMVVPLLALCAAWGWRARAAGDRALRGLGAAAAVLLALLTADVAANRLSALFSPPALAAVDAPAADGVRAPPREAAALGRVVALVRSRVPPGGEIYVAPRRSDLIKLNNPLVYVLTERGNASGEDFGLLASARAQRRIVARLEAARPAVVVRWTDPVSSQREPNERGEPSGSRLLDRWLERNYRLLRRLYHYDLLVPR
jgi:hypothetical protein